MNILHIWDSDYPWDVRVEKINDVLVEMGHKVFLVCRNKARRQLNEHLRGVDIHRLPYLDSKYGRLNSIVSFPAFFSPLWKYHTLKVARQHKIDLIIVRDLPLVLLALWTAKKIKVPVILDMAENYPHLLESTLQYGNSNLLNILIRNPKLARIIENLSFKRISKIVVVIEESRDRLLRLGVKPNKIEIVRNTPVKSFFIRRENITIPGDSFFREKPRFVILYNGLTNPSRGVLDFLRIMPKLVDAFPKIRFVINGKGEDDSRIHSEIERLGLKETAFHKGWVSHEDKKAYLAHCDVGLIPYRITSHWNTTIPNKVFDYMSMGKPVLCTNIAPTARIVNECRSGLTYEHGNISDLIQKLKMLMNGSNRELYGQNGLKMVQKKYNWEYDKKTLVRVINEFS